MIRHAIPTTVAALLAAFLAVPAAAQPLPASSGPVSRCDRPMADAETMGANVSSCFDVVAASRAAIAQYAGQREALAKILEASKPAGKTSPGVALSTGGPLGAAERALGREMKTETAPAAWPEEPAYRGLSRLPELEQLRNYHLYTAFATGDPSFCDRLKYVKKDRVCRQDLADLQFWRDRLGTDQEFEKACRGTEYTETRLQDKAAQAKTNACCAQVAASRSGTPNCAAMVPNCFPDQGTCRAFFGSLKGDAASCDGIKLSADQGCESQAACKAMGTNTPCDGSPETFAARCAALLEDDKAVCRATARFSGAWRSKDAGQCGGDERCRVLMGQGKQVAAEIAAKHLQTPSAQWFLTEGWKKPVVTSSKLARDPKKQVVPQAPVAKTPPAQPAQPAIPGLPTEAQRKALDFKGFVCQEPIGSVENRKAIAATMSAAHVCLTDIDSALASPSAETSEAIDAREERLARLNHKMAGLFGDVKNAAPAPKPAKPAAPAKSR